MSPSSNICSKDFFIFFISLWSKGLIQYSHHGIIADYILIQQKKRFFYMIPGALTAPPWPIENLPDFKDALIPPPSNSNSEAAPTFAEPPEII